MKYFFTLIVRFFEMLFLTTYSQFLLNNKLLVCYSSHDLYNEPFTWQTILDHLNTELVCYSDPHCNSNLNLKFEFLGSG